MKKITVLILICFCFTSTIVSAGEMQTTFYKQGLDLGAKYTHIIGTDCKFTINSSGKATIVSAATGYSNVDKTTAEAHLMRYKDGKWVEYKEWSTTNYGSHASVITTYYVPKGYRYKLICEMYVYDKSGEELEHVTKITNEVKY